jgi:hypothetical protein
MKLKSWLVSAEEFFLTAQFLENLHVKIKLKIPSSKSSWYLLHHSIELLLKAILINYNKFDTKNSQIHSLEKLLDKVKGLNKKIDKTLEEKHAGKSVNNWITFIDSFGFPKGGLRYLQKKSHIYAAPIGISEYFNKLIEVVKSESNLDKDIESIVFKRKRIEKKIEEKTNN